MLRFLKGTYTSHVVESFRPSVDLAVEPVAKRAGKTTKEVKREIARGLESYLNLGQAPSGCIKLDMDDRFGQVFSCPLAGVQVIFCVIEETYQIIIVGVGV